ncbi:MAG: GNAT family N-acetyltransferase [Tessaracoccus sp.]|uniref:GNAT family N-acetyltransferase n=1 Tax=Tessaracoccus sp. TaxID=1971211 RepID=UPI001EC1C9EF|nr:GNAT family N-acetyltransferase [Tessaracoccus sp.]MBK7820993.1 GNAT family N-acetyltransferase [Tessaracoccus sp.]
MRFITDRLTIRRFEPDDWRDLHDYLSRPEVVAYEPYDVYSEAQAREESARRAEDPAFWAVEARGEARVVGNVWLGENGVETRELGYVFNSRDWGKGFASEACRELVGWAFSEGTRRIVAECNPLNLASWQLLERLGFRREGHLIENVAFRRDDEGRPVWQDTYVYALLASEWMPRHGAMLGHAVRAE